MTKDELFADLRHKLEAHLDALTSTQTPGSIIAAFHCDSSGLRKVVVSTEEAWTLRIE